MRLARALVMSFSTAAASGCGGVPPSPLPPVLEVGAARGPDVPVIIRSTQGDGEGRADAEFRSSRLEMRARDVSSFAPFNAYRITQQYQYGEGKLVETVELIERDGEGRESSFVRIRERAALFAPTSFEQPPTRAEAVSSLRP